MVPLDGNQEAIEIHEIQVRPVDHYPRFQLGWNILCHESWPHSLTMEPRIEYIPKGSQLRSQPTQDEYLLHFQAAEPT